MANTIPELLKRLWQEVKRLFSLHLDTDEAGTIENVKKSIEFRGGNLWGLIFACLVAAIGLNTNSTAVVIGAMLISPLMGPIVGVGYSVGTNDFETLKYSFRNLALMIVVSIGASAIYFLLSPLKDPTAELIARIRPSLYDVLIAIFGGVVGIVASSRKDRGNAIPGVAIATALMPPLCTAGFGLATGRLDYFIGAFYLFFINSLFIALTTMIVVRSLQFPQKEFLDKKREKKVRILIWSLVILTIIPSLVTAWFVVNEAVFERRATQFVTETFQYDNRDVLRFETTYGRDSSVIEIIILGEELKSNEINNLRKKMREVYGLKNTFLDIHQNREKAPIANNNNSSVDVSKFNEIYQDKLEALEYKNYVIDSLRQKIIDIENLEPEMYRKKLDEVTQKIAALYPEIEEMGFSEVVKTTIRNDTIFTDTIPTAIVYWKNGAFTDKYKNRLLKYLKMEIKLDTVEVVSY